MSRPVPKLHLPSFCTEGARKWRGTILEALRSVQDAPLRLSEPAECMLAMALVMDSAYTTPPEGLLS